MDSYETITDLLTVNEDAIAHVIERSYSPIEQLDKNIEQAEKAMMTVQEWGRACAELSRLVPDGFTFLGPSDPDNDLIMNEENAERYRKAYALLSRAREYRFVKEGMGLPERAPLFPKLLDEQPDRSS